MPRHLERARSIATWLDNRYLDPIVGLIIPGAGDVLTSAAGLYLIAVAIQHELPAIVIARMLFNLAIDAALGAVPVAGDLFDFAFKANRRNLALLERRSVSGGRSRPGDWLVVIAAVLVFLAALALPIWLAARLIAHVFE
jgi:hypothetical protein